MCAMTYPSYVRQEREKEREGEIEKKWGCVWERERARSIRVIRMTRLIHVCDMSPFMCAMTYFSYVQNEYLKRSKGWFGYMKRHIHICDTHNSFICVPWYIHTCARTHSCVPGLIHMCHALSFICATWERERERKRDRKREREWAGETERARTTWFICMTCLIQICDVS